MNAPDQEPTARNPNLDHRLASLQLSKRVMRICEALGIETIGDFLATSREQFLAVPGCGARTYGGLRESVERFLECESGHSTPLTIEGSNLPLTDVIRSRRALHAFDQLGLKTVGDLLRTPRAELLKVQGFGEHSYERAIATALAACNQPTWHLALLPSRLVLLPVRDLGLEPRFVDALAALELHTVGDLLSPQGLRLAIDPSIGPEGTARLRRVLETLLAIGIDSFDAYRGTEADGVFDRLLPLLAPADRELLVRHLGISGTSQSVAAIARTLNRAVDEVRSRLESARVQLVERGAGILRRLQDEATRLLRANEGVLTVDDLTPGGLLLAASEQSNDPELPFRLLCFCYPRQFYLHTGLLTEIAPKLYRNLLRAIETRTHPRRLPLRLSDLEDAISANVGPAPRGLVLELLRSHCGVCISVNTDGAELIEPPPDPIADRLEAILDELGEPIQLEDLMFHYRDRHRSARKDVLGQRLRANPRFIEVGAELWSLRERHVVELVGVAAIADQMTELLLRLGGRRNVRDLAGDEALSERHAYLIIDCLRSCVFLRDLGRGDFCSRGSRLSSLMTELTHDFRRAMGAVPRSRFLVNLPPHRRRLVARLLRENRKFIEPGADRVDLLTNYPFNEERMHRLLVAVERHLESKQGYSTLDETVAAINETDLGGSFLTRHMLRDLLRRNGNFELLPGDLLALEELELGGWIQLKAREVIRSVGLPLTAAELPELAPDLTEFADCIESLLRKDPLLHTPDGERYSLV